MATGDDFTLCDDSTGSDREFGEEKLCVCVCSCFLKRQPHPLCRNRFQSEE